MRNNLILVIVQLLLMTYLLGGGEAAENKPTVMFDQGHGQKFLIEKKGDLQLSHLSKLFQDEGYLVKTGTGSFSAETLQGVDVLVISGAFSPVNSNEVDAIMRFLDGGGSLCVMLHIPHSLTGLLSRLQVFASNGVILEEENLIGNEPRNFYVTHMSEHPITRGVKRFAVYGGWALMSDSSQGKIIARTGSQAWVDLNRDGKFNSTDAQQSFGVAVAGTHGKGRHVIFGDDAIFQNVFLEGENMPLGKNLVLWLQHA